MVALNHASFYRSLMKRIVNARDISIDIFLPGGRPDARLFDAVGTRERERQKKKKKKKEEKSLMSNEDRAGVCTDVFHNKICIACGWACTHDSVNMYARLMHVRIVHP